MCVYFSCGVLPKGAAAFTDPQVPNLPHVPRLLAPTLERVPAGHAVHGHRARLDVRDGVVVALAVPHGKGGVRRRRGGHCCSRRLISSAQTCLTASFFASRSSKVCCDMNLVCCMPGSGTIGRSTSSGVQLVIARSFPRGCAGAASRAGAPPPSPSGGAEAITSAIPFRSANNN